MSPRTRKSSGSNLSEYIGPGKELLTTELPTSRDLIRYGLFSRETNSRDTRNYSLNEMISEGMYPALMKQWEKANPLFLNQKLAVKGIY